jgi:hypothetical protein
MPASDFEVNPSDGFDPTTVEAIRRSSERLDRSDSFIQWADQYTRQSRKVLDRSRSSLETLKPPTRLRYVDVAPEQRLRRLGSSLHAW